MTDANDILMGGGAPTAKFATIGAVVTGTVLREPEARQQKDFRTQAPETWKDGSPKMMVVVQLGTTDRDPDRADDDGTRMLYIQGKHLTEAVRQAVRASGANGIHTGGQLTVQYVADGQAENGLNPPKLYAARYEPPAVSLAGVGAPTTQPAPAATAATVQQQIHTTPAAVGVLPQRPAQIDEGTWNRMDAGQQERVAAAFAAGQPGF